MQRTRKRNQKYNGSRSQPDEILFDSLVAALQKRSQISARFGFLRNVQSMSSQELSVQSAALVEWFPDDLEASLSGELVQFAALLNTDIGRQATTIASQPDATDDDIDVITTGEAVELHIYVPTNPGEYHAIVLSKRGDIAAHVSLSDGHELHWRAFVFEAATNKQCPVNDDWAGTPKHAVFDEGVSRASCYARLTSTRS